MSFASAMTGRAGIGRLPSLGPDTGYFEGAWASVLDSDMQRGAGKMRTFDIPLSQRNDVLKERFGKEVFELTGTTRPVASMRFGDPAGPTYSKAEYEASEKVDKFILQGRVSDPEKFKDIKTTKEIQEESAKISVANERHAQEILARNPSAFSRGAAEFTGGMIGVMTDPINAASMLLGAGEVKAGLSGWAYARAVVKAAAADGAINAGVEAFQTPDVMKWQEMIGHRYGFKEAASSIALAGVGGFAISGILRGTVPAVKRSADFAGSASSFLLDKVSSAKVLPKSVRDSAAYLSRVAHMEEGAPKGMPLDAAREKVSKTAEEIDGYNPVTRGPEADPVVVKERPKIEIEVDNIVARINDANKVIAEESKQYKRPVIEYLKRLGGLNSEGEMASELKVRDIGQKQVIGLFKKGKGQKTADAIPIQEFEDATGVKAIDDGNGYVDRNFLIDVISSEYKAKPSKRAQKAIDSLEELERMGIDTGRIDREAIKKVAGKTPDQLKLQQLADDLGVVLSENEMRYAERLLYESPGIDHASALDEALERAGMGDEMLDLASPEYLATKEPPEDIGYDIIPDEQAAIEADIKELSETMGDVSFYNDSGVEVTMKQFLKDIDGDRAVLDALEFCRLR